LLLQIKGVEVLGRKHQLSNYFKKSPDGEYIIIVPREFKDLIIQRFQNKVFIDEYGDSVIIKTKSRAILKNIIRMVYGSSYG